MDWSLVVGIVVFLECLLILRGLLELSRQIEDSLADLDQTLAEAIAAVVQNMTQSAETNPIQSALARVLENSMSGNVDREPTIIEVPRDKKGQFKINND